MNRRSKLRFPQGLKPALYIALSGTAEAVPSRARRFSREPSQRFRN
jgi:hypothetical protein